MIIDNDVEYIVTILNMEDDNVEIMNPGVIQVYGYDKAKEFISNEFNKSINNTKKSLKKKKVKFTNFCKHNNLKAAICKMPYFYKDCKVSFSFLDEDGLKHERKYFLEKPNIFAGSYSTLLVSEFYKKNDNFYEDFLIPTDSAEEFISKAKELYNKYLDKINSNTNFYDVKSNFEFTDDNKEVADITWKELINEKKSMYRKITIRKF